MSAPLLLLVATVLAVAVAEARGAAASCQAAVDALEVDNKKCGIQDVAVPFALPPWVDASIDRRVRAWCDGTCPAQMRRRLQNVIDSCDSRSNENIVPFDKVKQGLVQLNLICLRDGERLCFPDVLRLGEAVSQQLFNKTSLFDPRSALFNNVNGANSAQFGGQCVAGCGEGGRCAASGATCVCDSGYDLIGEAGDYQSCVPNCRSANDCTDFIGGYCASPGVCVCHDVDGEPLDTSADCAVAAAQLQAQYGQVFGRKRSGSGGGGGGGDDNAAAATAAIAAAAAAARPAPAHVLAARARLKRSIPITSFFDMADAIVEVQAKFSSVNIALMSDLVRRNPGFNKLCTKCVSLSFKVLLEMERANPFTAVNFLARPQIIGGLSVLHTACLRPLDDSTSMCGTHVAQLFEISREFDLMAMDPSAFMYAGPPPQAVALMARMLALLCAPDRCVQRYMQQRHVIANQNLPKFARQVFEATSYCRKLPRADTFCLLATETVPFPWEECGDSIMRQCSAKCAGALRAYLSVAGCCTRTMLDFGYPPPNEQQLQKLIDTMGGGPQMTPPPTDGGSYDGMGQPNPDTDGNNYGTGPYMHTGPDFDHTDPFMTAPYHGKRGAGAATSTTATATRATFTAVAAAAARAHRQRFVAGAAAARARAAAGARGGGSATPAPVAAAVAVAAAADGEHRKRQQADCGGRMDCADCLRENSCLWCARVGRKRTHTGFCVPQNMATGFTCRYGVDSSSGAPLEGPPQRQCYDGVAFFDPTAASSTAPNVAFTVTDGLSGDVIGPGGGAADFADFQLFSLFGVKDPQYTVEIRRWLSQSCGIDESLLVKPECDKVGKIELDLVVDNLAPEFVNAQALSVEQAVRQDMSAQLGVPSKDITVTRVAARRKRAAAGVDEGADGGGDDDEAKGKSTLKITVIDRVSKSGVNLLENAFSGDAVPLGETAKLPAKAARTDATKNFDTKTVVTKKVITTVDKDGKDVAPSPPTAPKKGAGGFFGLFGSSSGARRAHSGGGGAAAAARCAIALAALAVVVAAAGAW